MGLLDLRQRVADAPGDRGAGPLRGMPRLARPPAEAERRRDRVGELVELLAGRLGPSAVADRLGALRLLLELAHAAPVLGAAAVVAVLDDLRAPAWADIDLECLAGLDVPVLLTQGDRSPGWFLAIIARLHEAIPSAQVITIPGASHNPHGTHPADFAAIVAAHVETQKEAVR